MYLEHFGLMQMPFTISPDPDYMFLTSQHSETLAKCQYIVKQRGGLAVVYGDVGTGKSTVARKLYLQLSKDSTLQVSLLLNTGLKTEVALLRAIMAAYNVPAKRSHAANVEAFQEYALTIHKDKKTIVLLIDEAQQMTPKMLLLIRDLLNFETNKSKLIQIILFGQNELAATLDMRPMRAVKSRVSKFAALSSLTSSDTADMIAYRWKMAGGNGAAFTPAAIQAIYDLSSGLPREIIKLCDESLTRALANDSKKVTDSMVKVAADDLRMDKGK